MPSPAVITSLSSLLPTIPSNSLNPKLTSLCDSLLAQSRQRAAHLKSDEEIARAHACCEIACKRLRVQLRLPAVKQGGAPCKPVTYKRLITFLERLLSEDNGGVAIKSNTTTPQKRKLSQPQVVEESPSKKARISTGTHTDIQDGFTGKVKKTTSTDSNKDTQKETPSFVTPTIRKLCKSFSTTQMIPHVYTGTSIVLGLTQLWPRLDDDEDIDEAALETNITNLLIALYLMVLTRMHTGKMTTKLFRAISTKAVELLGQGSSTAEIEAWVKTINKEGYCKGQEWWSSVPEGVFEFSLDNLEGSGEADVELDEGRREDDGGRERKRNLLDLDEDDPEGVLLPALGTMMQDAVDWTSEERKRDYVQWKKDILMRIDKGAKGRRSIAVS